MKANLKLLFIITGATALALAQPSPARAANLVQYWPFEEVGASTATNVIAGGNVARLFLVDTNLCWLSGDVPGQLAYSTAAINLDGVDDYLNLGNLRLNGRATVSLWVRPANYNSTDMRLYSPVWSTNPNGGMIRVDPFGTGNWQVSSGAAWLSLCPANTVPAGQWTHLAFAYGDGLVSMYLNGALIATTSATFPFDQSEFGLGQNYVATGSVFNGSLDDVSIWDGPLSTNAIAQLAAGVAPTAVTDPLPPPPPAAKLVQYFALNDGPGSATASNGVVSGNLGMLVNYNPSTPWVTSGLPAPLANDTAALFFDNTVSNRVDLGNFGLASAGTISLWIKVVTNGGDMRIYSQTTGGAGMPGSIGFVGVGGLQCWDGSAFSRIAPDGAVPTNQWTHLAVTYSRGVATAFINGLPQMSTRAGFLFGTNNFGLGAQLQLTTGKSFSGWMDDVSVWDQALSPTSIRHLAQGVSPLSIVDVPEPVAPISLSFKLAAAALPKLTQYFPLEEASGSSTVANAVAGGNTGTLVNYTSLANAWVTTGLPPRLPGSTTALFCDGISNYINLKNLGLNGSATVSFWVKPATLETHGTVGQGTRRLFSQLTGATTQQGALGANPDGGLWVASTSGSIALVGPSALASNQWFHLAYTYSGGSATLYVDGVERWTVAAGFAFSGVEAGLGAQFLNRYGSTYFGLFDDVAIWNGPLSPASIQQLAAGVAPPAIAVTDGGQNLLLSWPAYPGVYVLQTTGDLAHGWSNANRASVLANTTWSVTVPIYSSTPRQFYRLKKL